MKSEAPAKPAETPNLPPLEYVEPIAEFFNKGPIAAMCLLVSALVAMAAANTGIADQYFGFLHTYAGLSVGELAFKQSIHHWINDGLMSIFFFVIGLEIKRELIVGELASFKKALLPAFAAVGGMVAPALIYYLINYGEPTARGWGIPMATDIAFATGCLALVGGRVPRTLAIFLLALAIVDDIGGVLVIALFYSKSINLQPLYIGAAIFAISTVMNFTGVRRTFPYAVLGIALWFCFLQSGVHATIAGVLFAFSIPSNARYQARYFNNRMQTLIEKFTKADDDLDDLRIVDEQQVMIRHMLRECHHVEPPLQRIEYTLHPYSVFLIMPLFAFANAGSQLPLSSLGSVIFTPVSMGIFFALVVGKPLGITLMTWIAVKSGLATLPRGVTWLQIASVSMLAGIGFTVALFINGLAFDTTTASHDTPAAQVTHVVEPDSTMHSTPAPAEPAALAQGKVGIFAASFAAAISGILLLRYSCRNNPVVEHSGKH